MDTLPVELVDIILRDAGPLVWPALGCVCKEWRDLVLKRRPKKRFHDNRPYMWRHFMPKSYKHRCTSPSVCATFYMTRLIDAGHWRLLDWMVATLPFHVCGAEHSKHVQRYVCAQLASHGDTVRLYALCDTHRFKWDSSIICCAARYGHLDMVKLLYNGFCSDNRVCHRAARGGHLSVLQWTLDVQFERSAWTCERAARGGHLEVLRWLRANGYRWDTCTTAGAARNGHLHVLMWATANGCPVDATAVDAAAGRGHLDVVKWLIVNAFPWGTSPYNSALKAGHMHVAEWLHAQGLPLGDAARGVDNVHAFEWLSNKGYAFDARTLWCAGCDECPNATRWLIERGVTLGMCQNNDISMMGDLGVLMLMHDRSFTIPPGAASFGATLYGRLDTLQWLHANGYIVVKDLCRIASEQCHLHILRWARAHEFPWDETVCANAAENGDLEMLQWARANGCPWHAEKVCQKAAKKGHLHILQWAADNGCVLDKAAYGTDPYGLHDHMVALLDARRL